MTDEQMRELGKQLPFDRPDAKRREALRASLLVAATRPEPARRKRWWLAGSAFAAGAIAAAAAMFLAIRDPEVTREVRAQARVDAPAGAQLEHVVTTTPSGIDEVVRVRAGVVRVAAATNRVRTRTADAEVESTGAYELAVVDDRLERVTVTTGTARITVAQQQPIFLAAGQSWRAPVVTTDVTPPPPIPAAPPKPVAKPSAKPSPPVVAVEEPRLPAVTTLDTSQPTSTERHFQRGWTLLREGKANEAAAELAIAAGGTDALADDARYFQAVALVRAGRAVEAERVLVEFLTRAPTSLRAGRAALLVGKLARDRGAAADARRWFELALRDGDATIAAAAKAHLESL